MSPYFDWCWLALQERFYLEEDLWDSIVAETDGLPLSDWQKAELERRDVEYREDPRLAGTWDEAKQRILAQHGR